MYKKPSLMILEVISISIFSRNIHAQRDFKHCFIYPRTTLSQNMTKYANSE